MKVEVSLSRTRKPASLGAVVPAVNVPPSLSLGKFMAKLAVPVFGMVVIALVMRPVFALREASRGMWLPEVAVAPESPGAA